MENANATNGASISEDVVLNVLPKHLSRLIDVKIARIIA